MIKDFGANITLICTPEQVITFTRLLDQIAMVPKEYQTLLIIYSTPHEVVIQNSDQASLSAGRTIAHMTMGLINGTWRYFDSEGQAFLPCLTSIKRPSNKTSTITALRRLKRHR